MPHKLDLWPVPASYSQKLPQKGEPGSFGENRTDRIHCGVDIYAPEDSDVLAVASGAVIDSGEFTSPDVKPYWNKTYYISVSNGVFIFIYAELGEVFVRRGDFIEQGELIGRVGLVLNSEKISRDEPEYIRRLSENHLRSMLHLELRLPPYRMLDNYLAGNYFGSRLPDCFVEMG